MKQHSQAALCATALRAELKNAFPGIKFSVRSSSFANGNSVDIHWTNGPTYDDVNDIAKKYQAGSFDGMTDMYEYDNDRGDLPQAKYVHCVRKYSESAYENTRTRLMDEWGLADFEDATVLAATGKYPREFLYREMFEVGFIKSFV